MIMEITMANGYVPKQTGNHLPRRRRRLSNATDVHGHFIRPQLVLQYLHLVQHQKQQQQQEQQQQQPQQQQQQQQQQSEHQLFINLLQLK